MRPHPAEKHRREPAQNALAVATALHCMQVGPTNKLRFWFLCSTLPACAVHTGRKFSRVPRFRPTSRNNEEAGARAVPTACFCLPRMLIFFRCAKKCFLQHFPSCLCQVVRLSGGLVESRSRQQLAASIRRGNKMLHLAPRPFEVGHVVRPGVTTSGCGTPATATATFTTPTSCNTTNSTLFCSKDIFIIR